MALADDLKDYVGKTFREAWSVHQGQVVPSPEKLNAGNHAIAFDRATVLYADLSGSTSMVDMTTWQFAAEIYKNFLYCAARLINNHGGTITAYDGDRVMGIFVGKSQSTSAAKCALKINYATKKIIMPAMKEQYRTSAFILKHVVGVDTSPLRVAKTGVRGENDLVWVGRAANYAAKLTELSADFGSRITGDVFKNLDDEAKYSQKDKILMWEKRSWSNMNNMEIYRSHWCWEV